MRSIALLLFALVSTACPLSRAFAQEVRGDIISAGLAQRYGLRKSWVVQGQVNRATDKLEYVTLSEGGLFLLTRGGVLQMIDAETGTTRWHVQFGNRRAPVTGPGAGAKYVAMTSGATLYVVDRESGVQVLERSLQHTPTASPVVWDKFIYVPLFNGMITTFDASVPKKTPWFFRSTGLTQVPPIVSSAALAWTTSNGHMHASSPDKLGVRFRFDSNGEIVAPLGYQSPYIYVCSNDGFAYAVDEMTGRVPWRFSAGTPISHQPVAIRDSVFIIPNDGGMYCLSAVDGKQRWFAPRVKQFLAASPARAQTAAAGAPAPKPGGLGRLYVADNRGDIMILDAASGSRLDTMPAAHIPWKFTNVVNDRLYLGSRSGLIQCLHEIGLNEPTSYIVEPKTTPPAGSGAPGDAAAPGEDMPADPADDAAPEADPFAEP